MSWKFFLTFTSELIANTYLVLALVSFIWPPIFCSFHNLSREMTAYITCSVAVTEMNPINRVWYWKEEVSCSDILPRKLRHLFLCQHCQACVRILGASRKHNGFVRGCAFHPVSLNLYLFRTVIKNKTLWKCIKQDSNPQPKLYYCFILKLISQF